MTVAAAPTGGIEFRVLGPLEVLDGRGRVLTPSGALQRRLLAALVLRRGQVVAADRLAELLWPGRLPVDHPAALHTHVYRLRRRLPDGMLVQQPPGYRLVPGEATVDAERFERALSQGAALVGRDPQRALQVIDEALGWWRGDAYADLVDADEGRIELERLGELRMRADEERFAALLAAGRAGEAVADLEAFVARHPLRERPRAALLSALAHVGRRADALRVYDEYRRVLAEELGVDPSAALAADHQRLLDGGEDERPARGTASPPVTPGPTTSLPRPTSSLVGRDELLDEIGTKVAAHRLVTLLGTGGVGKTRLALEAASRLHQRFPDGVWFCELAAAGADAVPTVVATCLGIEERSGVAWARRIADALRHQRALVVLDNCEHVVDAIAALVEQVLAETTEPRLLATSRERLSVTGEVLCAVPPLAWHSSGADTAAAVRAAADRRPGSELRRGSELRAGADAPAAARAGRVPDAADPAGAAVHAGLPPAVQLFAERASLVDDRFELDAARLPVVAEIVRRLDGLPLAIELAATRLHALTVQEVRDGLDHRFALLDGGRRSVPRHRSLAAALSWSYDLLDDTDRRALDRLGVFEGSFTVHDAAAVLEIPASVTRGVLAGLVDRSLLQPVQGRFALLETVRQFATAHLAERGEARAVQRLHLARSIALVDEVNAALRTGDGRPLASVESALADLRAAFDRAVDFGDTDAALRLATALRDPAVVAMRPELLAWGTRAAALPDATDHPLAPEAFGVAAVAAWKAGDFARAGELLSSAEALGRATGSPPRYAIAEARGTVAMSEGRLDDALAQYRSALAAPDARDDVLHNAETGATVAMCLAYLGDPSAAAAGLELVERARRDLRPVPAAWCWYGAGEAVLEADHGLARERLAVAEDLSLGAAASFIAGVSGASLASLDVRHGSPADAMARYRRLLPLWLRAGVRVPLWTMLRSVCELLAAAGAHESAATLLGAVTSGAGAEVYGRDEARLRGLHQSLAERLGAPALAAAVAGGRELDDAAAAAVATAAFDELDPV